MSEAEEQSNKRPKDKGAGQTRSFDGSTPSPGSQIGPFHIEQELGRGGAGVVYLAHDTKLDRSVAIKSLPPEVMDNPKALSRFTREARVLASLNHPNIATIYDELEEAEGLSYLVLEYVPGQTLAERIAKGPLKLDEVLTIALQIAEAVAAAHEHDIIHRDLKPGNIKITPEDKVKVLDFGLAKVVGGEATDQQTTITEPGRVIGTPAYMSPEQARGKPTDKRSDIWSFGCVLYEMLTGRIPFKGETISDTLANILDHNPNWQALPESTPANIRVLLRRCLEKNPRRRLQHIGDASIEISETLTLPATAPPVTSLSVAVSQPTGLWRLMVLGLFCLVLVAVVASLVTRSLIRPELPAPPVISRFVLQPHSKIANEALFHHALAISQDGKHIAYVDEGTGTEKLMLYVRELSAFQERAIPGTEGAMDPFFSPDGESLGYSDHTRGTLEVVSIRGGSPTTLSDKAPYFGGGVWLDNGTIIFSPDWNSGLWSISATGGTAQALTTLDLEEGEIRHIWPTALPNNNDILFTSYRLKKGIQEGRIEVVSSSTGTRHLLLSASEFGRYVPSGHLIFVRNGSLFGARFDLKSFTLQSKPVPLPERILHNPRHGATQLACANTGILAYIPAPPTDRKLVWVNDRGLAKPLAAPPHAYNSVSLAPDGTQIALSIGYARPPNSDISLYDIERATLTQLTFNSMSMLPQWLDNSRQLAYLKYNSAEDIHDLLCLYMDGSRNQKLLARVPPYFFRGYSIDKGQKHVLGTVSLQPKDENIVVMSLRDGDSQERTVVDESHLQRLPVFSPDGRWFAYSSRETGSWEVYVNPFPGPGAKKKISHAEGYEPLWDPHSNKLYYRNGDEMWMVTYESDTEFKPAQPEFLFDRHFFGGLAAGQKTYSVARDGRFLMIQEDLAPGTQINIVLNWFEELKRLVPPGKNQ
jgi:serine/threonine protein kinase